MRDDWKSQEGENQPQNVPNAKPPKKGGGCITSGLYLMGFLTILYGTVGYIAGLFDYELSFSGSRVGKIRLEVFIPLLIVGAIFFLLGFLINLIAKKIRNKKG